MKTNRQGESDGVVESQRVGTEEAPSWVSRLRAIDTYSREHRLARSFVRSFTRSPDYLLGYSKRAFSRFHVGFAHV